MVKVIGVGFQKTGTTSLWNALNDLEIYTINSMPPQISPNIWTTETILSVVNMIKDRCDGFVNNPYPSIFKELDQMFPRSKFILTVRRPDDWIRSMLRQFADFQSSLHVFTYGTQDGCPYGNEQQYVNVFNRHNQNVRTYFKDRSQDLLEMDITKGDGWELLCHFLGISEIPKQDFPWLVSKSSNIGINRISENTLYKNLENITF